MAWIALILSVVVLWVASLCKILQGSSSASKSTFLEEGGSTRRRNVLLVIAHPDDESMFFAPVINYLVSEGHNLHILCMSTGNADGMGSIRKEELYLASAVLKVSTNIVRKYIGPVDIWLSTLLGRCLRTGQSHCLLNLYPRRSYNAMAQHSSQWVWYRKLFVAFSSYTYVNTLKKIASWFTA
ncbi:UNVERIFIED_CONTAM: putative N-acetylglucosaminyl-phosphatidylinositol de-N-acetylase [Sesamum calycinum]|uniref:N-acetylglucosaminylphosphatidylinositol deacetylase n=1 Tax=Sesamum calycinum TaxID=2727403 RepID=A0AAW2NFM1_9LAMI